MLHTTRFEGHKSHHGLRHIVKGESHRGGGVVEMPGIQLPRLESAFNGKAEGGEHPRFINLLG